MRNCWQTSKNRENHHLKGLVIGCAEHSADPKTNPI